MSFTDDLVQNEGKVGESYYILCELHPVPNQRKIVQTG